MPGVRSLERGKNPGYYPYPLQHARRRQKSTEVYGPTKRTKRPSFETITELKYDPRIWEEVDRPANFQGDWPPASAAVLMNVNFDLDKVGSRRKQANFMRRSGDLMKDDCLGQRCWQQSKWGPDIPCAHDFDAREPCNHTFTEWKQGYADWKSKFKVRRVENMNYGLVSRQAWKKDDVLGVYLGELIPDEPKHAAYCHEVTVGPEFSKGSAAVIAYVDAARYGNYTRFCNHSCDNNAVITEARIGDERVLVLRAIRAIASNEQVCVDYGSDYFCKRQCLCKTERCRYPKLINPFTPVDEK